MLQKEMLPSDAPFLAANNPAARLHMYKAWQPHIINFGFKKLMYLVTLAPKKYSRSVREAKNFDVYPLQQWAASWLLGFDYVAIVEAAHHSYAYGSANEPYISFHVHALVVIDDDGSIESREKIAALEARMEKINERYPAFRFRRKSADMKDVYDMSDLAGYLMKEPFTDYRIPRPLDMPELDDPDDAPVKLRTQVPTSRPVRGTVRPGVQLQIMRATRSWYLDKIILAGGSGVQVMENIRRDALRGLPRSMRARRQHEFSGYFEQPEERDEAPRYSNWVRLFKRYDFNDYSALKERQSLYKRRLKALMDA